MGQESLGVSHQAEIQVSVGNMILCEAQEPVLSSLVFGRILSPEAMVLRSCLSAGSQPGSFLSNSRKPDTRQLVSSRPSAQPLALRLSLSLQGRTDASFSAFLWSLFFMYMLICGF